MRGRVRDTNGSGQCLFTSSVGRSHFSGCAHSLTLCAPEDADLQRL